MRRETVAQKVFKQAEDYLRENPELAHALEVFQISNQQYKSALLALSKAETSVSNSTNEE